YRQRGKCKEMTLGTAEFARRFLQHVLPRGFVRVRHYGLLANRGRDEKLRQCRRLLWLATLGPKLTAAVEPVPEEKHGQGAGPGGGGGGVEVVGVLPAWFRPGAAAAQDSS